MVLTPPRPQAFVCLTLYCSACVVDKKMSALGKREGYPVIMPDGLGDLLCSEVQQSFWTAVYNFYNNTKISLVTAHLPTMAL